MPLNAGLRNTIDYFEHFSLGAPCESACVGDHHVACGTVLPCSIEIPGSGLFGFAGEAFNRAYISDTAIPAASRVAFGFRAHWLLKAAHGRGMARMDGTATGV